MGHLHGVCDIQEARETPLCCHDCHLLFQTSSARLRSMALLPIYFMLPMVSTCASTGTTRRALPPKPPSNRPPLLTPFCSPSSRLHFHPQLTTCELRRASARDSTGGRPA